MTTIARIYIDGELLNMTDQDGSITIKGDHLERVDFSSPVTDLAYKTYGYKADVLVGDKEIAKDAEVVLAKYVDGDGNDVQEFNITTQAQAQA